ncbi:PREDICTED: akirin-2 [Charadrius vociferus]|uniref:akirin-2 n=1 Tax=Charadrius vociferus TaxID=50402 RepID=UPI0005215A39|nr:PREDICTED: akirin-2 [Charadrius vociferus]
MLCLGDLQAQNNNEGNSSDPTSDKVEREYMMGKGFDHIRQDQLKEGLDGKVYVKKQILYNIKQEYKRMQKRRHLENSFQQTDPCCSTDAQPHAFLLTGPALPGTSSAASSPLKKEQPLFTLRQVGMICERLLKEREEKIREEYEEILTTKLAEQYDAFVKFTHDQIMRRYGEQPASYVS